MFENCNSIKSSPRAKAQTNIAGLVKCMDRGIKIVSSPVKSYERLSTYSLLFCKTAYLHQNILIISGYLHNYTGVASEYYIS